MHRNPCSHRRLIRRRFRQPRFWILILTLVWMIRISFSVRISFVELATELSGNSETALGNIKTEVNEHSSALSELIRGASVKVGDVLHDLHSNLKDQEQSVAAFWQQQHECQLRAYQTTQSASSSTVNFVKTMRNDIFVVKEMVEDAIISFALSGEACGKRVRFFLIIILISVV